VGSSSKKTTSSSTQTTTPINAPWVTSSLQGLNSRINSLGQVDPSSYVAPASDLQNASYSAGANLGSNSGLFGQASNIASGVASSGPAMNSGGAQTSTDGLFNSGGQSMNAAQLGDVSQYMNPYIKNVIDASNAYADQNDAAQLGQLKAQAAGSGAFGDSTYGIAQGQTLGQQALARQQTNAGLLANGYNQAQALNQYDTSNRQSANATNASLAQQAMLANQTTGQDVALSNTANRQQSDLANQTSSNDALNRQLSAAGLLGNLGTAQGADARANATTQDTLGQDQRSIAQSQATAPISLAQALAQLYGSNQFGLLQGQTSTGNSTSTSTSNPGLLGSVGQGLQVAGSAAALFSDIRLKTDIRPLGRDAEGRNRYAWRYLWGQHGEGYLAHEVAKTDPQAVGEFAGFLTVDHTKMRGCPQWLV